MRSKYRAVCIALVAALAVTALSAGSAFAALPEFSPIYKTKETFSGKAVGVTKWEISTGIAWEDTEATISGEIVLSGPHARKALQNVTMKFVGGGTVGAACRNKSNELVLTGLEAYLGYINESTKEIGLAFFEPWPEGGNWFFQALASCTVNPVGGKLEGVIVVPLTEAKTFSKTHSLAFTQEKGKMTYGTVKFKWEGGKLPWGGFGFPLHTQRGEENLFSDGIQASMPFVTEEPIEVIG